MKAYKYDGNTKEYLGEVSCQLDPLESKAQNSDVYLLPANATLEELPIYTEDETIIYNEGWQVIEDIRKKVFYSKVTAQIVKVNLNDDISDLTELEPCEYPKWDGKKWIIDTEAKKKAKLIELDSKAKTYIYENIGTQEKQSKYLALFCSLQEKRLDGEELTEEETATKDALKLMHSRYKEILLENAEFETKINNGEDIQIIFTK